MTEDQKKIILKAHECLERAKHAEGTDISDLTDAVSFIAGDPEFRLVIRKSAAPVQIEGRADMDALCFMYLMMLLMKRDYEAAAALLWDSDTFTLGPKSVKDIWKELFTQRLLNILGGSSLGKTYSASAWFLLDWVLDPEWTMVRVMSTKEDHLKKNLFADIQRLYEGSVVKLPGHADSESIATDSGRRMGMGIFTLTIAAGPNAPAAIKGAKVKPRPRHPLFGTSSRTRILVDEAQEVPTNVFDEVPNLFASFEEGDVEHTKVMMSANPADEFSRYGKNCRPVGGWEGVQTKSSEIERWMSETGWRCLRLNALKSENFIQKKTVFPRFFTYEGYLTKLRQYNGDPDHPKMWSEVYGMFPPKGHMKAIIQKHWMDRSYGEWIFNVATDALSGEDVAFSGDHPTMTSARIGVAVAWMDFNGVRHDLPEPRWALQIDTTGRLARGDTQELADESMSRLKVLGVKPQHFAMDRTGNGQGVHDNIRRQWRQKVDGADGRSEFGAQVVDIIGINYSEVASEIRISEEDTRPPKELYEGVRSEMWYAAARFLEYGYIRIGRGVEPRTIEQLVSRRGGTQSQKSKKMMVESKDDFRERGFSSPDEADSFCMVIHAARVSFPEFKAKAPDTVVEPEAPRNVLTDDDSMDLKFGEPMEMSFGDGGDQFGGIDMRRD